MFRVRNAPEGVKEAEHVNVRAPPTLTAMTACPVPMDASWNADAFSGPSSQYLPFTNDDDDPDAKPWVDPHNYWVPRSEVRAVNKGGEREAGADAAHAHGHQHRSRPVATLSSRTRHVRGHHH